MANSFNHFLAVEDYGQTVSKISTVLFMYIMICDIPVEDKLSHILTVFGIDESQ
jgi:hypothetical protein